MHIEYDPIKDEANQRKHGLSLAAAAQLDWPQALVWTDARRDYGEHRQAALGYIGQRLHYAAFTIRGQTLRIISLRRANTREIQFYANTQA